MRAIEISSYGTPDVLRLVERPDPVAGAGELLIYPPVPTSVARVADVERMQMLVEAPTRGAIQRVLTPWMAALPSLRGQHKAVLRWALDVDPLAI